MKLAAERIQMVTTAIVSRMPPKNSTVVGSLLLTTLLTNCQLLPVTQPLLRAEPGSRYGPSPEAASWRVAAAAAVEGGVGVGGGGGGGADTRGERLAGGEVGGAALYSRDSRLSLIHISEPTRLA